jgi:hypothetical protein
MITFISIVLTTRPSSSWSHTSTTNSSLPTAKPCAYSSQPTASRMFASTTKSPPAGTSAHNTTATQSRELSRQELYINKLLARWQTSDCNPTKIPCSDKLDEILTSLQQVVNSHHSASQDTLRNCTKCRGILARARFEPSLAWRQMRLLVGVTVRNSRSSAPFPSTMWSTAQGYFYKEQQSGRSERCRSCLNTLRVEPPALRLHSNLFSSNPKNRPKMAVRRPPAVTSFLYGGLRSS